MRAKLPPPNAWPTASVGKWPTRMPCLRKNTASQSTISDTDALFEEKYRISIDDFFHKYDEPLYRKLESQVLKETESLENTVISTGGGTACYFDNMEWMNRHGLTVFMRISEKAVIDRLLHAKRKRPLSTGKTEAELTVFVQQHYTSRLPFYEQARITVKSEDLDLENLIKLIENEKDK